MVMLPLCLSQPSLRPVSGSWFNILLSLILRSELVDSEFRVEKQLWVFGFRTGDQRWLNQLGVCSRWVEGVPVDYKEPASMDL